MAAAGVGLLVALQQAVVEGGSEMDTATILVLGVLIASLALLARIANRLRLSPIPLYLLAGIAFGRGRLLPLEIPESAIEIGATVGVLLLLFMLGLEYTSDELSASLRRGWNAGLVDAVLNFTPGLVLAAVLGWGPVAAILLGGVTFVSSSGIIAKVLDDLGWLGNRETPAVLSVLVVEDLAMAAYLPIVGVLLVGRSPLEGMVSVAVAVTAAGIALLLALRYGGLLSRALRHSSNEVLLLSTLGLVLIVSGAADVLQVSAAIGAFLVGVALTGEVAAQVRVLLGPLRDLFAATFFLFFGLQLDPADLREMLALALMLALVTSLTKVATGWWAAARAGVGVPGRVRAGAALVARGEFSIVLAGLGVSAGLEPQLGPLAATYVLLTAIAGPVLTQLSEPVGLWLQSRIGRRAPAAVPSPPPALAAAAPPSAPSYAARRWRVRDEPVDAAPPERREG